ncbi:uncharacterized protein [Argopecten irradians]|uniref:uncharacterized protein n=1 Tax=Argopecten irradians TaxID=31199 RepID=UPI00371CA0F0
MDNIPYLSSLSMETETSEAGMEARDYSQSDNENPESKPLMEISNGPESDDLTDSASEAEMEIQIGAVFSLASDDTNKQNEIVESEPNVSATTSFTESTVSAVENDTLNKSDESDVTQEENYIENSMNAENMFETDAPGLINSTMDKNNDCVEPPRPLSSFVKVEMDTSGRTCLSKTTKDSVSRHSKTYSKKTTEHTAIKYDNKNIINGKKVSYCYVKLFDILHHRVVRQEVMNVDKKPEIDNEATFQELDQSQKTQPKKKMKKKPPRLTRKKKMKKKAKTDVKEVPKLQEENPSTAATNITPLPLPDSTPDTIPLRPSRKRKFNRKLITDAVFFDSRGISNFEDHVIQKQEEEEMKCRMAPTYGFRGSRPQVARTKKKLNRIQREDMPFISVIIDSEKMEKIEKTNLASSKEKVNRPISCLLDRKVILYATLLRTSSGSFRILKDRTKSSVLKTIAKAMKDETLKSKSKQSCKSNSEQTESGIKKSKAVSVLKNLIMKKKHQATPPYRQMVSGLNPEATPACQQRVTESTAEVTPPYRQMVSGLNALATPVCQQRVTEPTAEATPPCRQILSGLIAEATPVYQQRVTEPTAEAFPPNRQMVSVANVEATPTYRQLVSSPTAEADPQYQRMVTHAEDKVDMKAALPSTKHLATNSNSSVPPVKVEPGTFSSAWNKGNFISAKDRVSLTGGYRKLSDKCSSFTTNFERNWNVPPKLSGKTVHNSEPHPYIEIDTVADAESVVQKQQGEIYNRSSHFDHMYSSDTRKRQQKQEPTMTKLPKPPKPFVKGLAQSSQNKGDIVPKVVPNVTTEQSAFKPNSGNLKSFKPKMTLAIQPPKSLSEQSNLFKSTVNELAKAQNTKKFYQLRIGDKMVLIPADGGDVIPKAYVLDVASNPLFTRTCTGNSTTFQIPGLCTAKSSNSSTNLVDSKIAVGDTGITRESKEYELTQTSHTDSVLSKLSNPPSAIKDSVEDIKPKLSLETGSVKQPLISPPVLSPQIEISGSLYSYSKHTSPVLIPKTNSSESGGCNDTEPPVLHQEVVSCEGDASNLNQIKKFPPMLHKGDSPGEVSTSTSCLPTSGDRPPPQLTLVSDGTVVVKKDPARLRNFEGDKSTKDSLSTITTQGPGSVDNVDNQNISSLDSKPPLETGFVSAVSENDMGNPSNKTDLTPPVVDCNQPNPLSSSSTKDNGDKGSSLHPSVDSVVNDQDTPRSNEEIKDRDKFGIETVTHIPADETMVQQRIRQLRERLRETQVNLDNIRKTNRMKKENMEDGYDT